MICLNNPLAWKVSPLMHSVAEQHIELYQEGEKLKDDVLTLFDEWPLREDSRRQELEAVSEDFVGRVNILVRAARQWFTSLNHRVLSHTVYEKKDLMYHLGRIEEHLRHPNYQFELQDQKNAISTAFRGALAIIESVPATSPLEQSSQRGHGVTPSTLNNGGKSESKMLSDRLQRFLQGLAHSRGRAAYRPDSNDVNDLRSFQADFDVVEELQREGILKIVGKPHRESRTAHSFVDLVLIELTGKGTQMFSEASASQERVMTSQTAVQDPRNVFVVHGRNLNARNSLFRFLRSIGLKPLEWSQAIQQTGKASPFIGEILDVAFSQAQAVVVLMTPDDVAQLQEPYRSESDPPYEAQLIGQARPNVLFEAGMAMGRHPDRTVIVELGTLRPFSDIAGRHTVRLSNDSGARQELAQRLETAGCAVDLTGRDWHTEGEFKLESALVEKVPRDWQEKVGGAAGQPQAHDDEYDEDDVISMIAAWLRSKNVTAQGFLITYSDVDRDLGFKPGTTKGHFKAAVADTGLYIEREGKSTSTVRRRISIA